jgi:hypothetical protein
MSLKSKIISLLAIKDLYSRILVRIIIKLKFFFKLPPVYPYEHSYAFDQDTQRIVDQLKADIPDEERGDSLTFNKQGTNIVKREEAGVHVSRIINRIIPYQSPNNLLSSDIEKLGYIQLPKKNLNGQQIIDIREYLDRQKVYPSHIAILAIEKPQDINAVKDKSNFGSYDLSTSVLAPHVAEIISDPDIINLMADYFGCLPAISGVNLFWSFVKDGKSRGVQRFHRDVDDYKSCTMFVNLTDTKEDDGAHCYIEKTHSIERLKSIFKEERNDDFPSDLNPFGRRITAEDLFQLPLHGYSFERIYDHFLKEHMIPLYGEKGSVILTDNYGIHRGLPAKNDRLILWVSYALTATQVPISEGAKSQRRVKYEKLRHRIPDTKMNRYVLRNIVDFS